MILVVSLTLLLMISHTAKTTASMETTITPDIFNQSGMNRLAAGSLCFRLFRFVI